MEQVELFEIVVVGGGIAGLTAACYASRAGRRVLLCEKSSALGGLVTSFGSGGFLFDGGARAFENSGILFPMLRQLGIELDFVRNPVTLGFSEEIIRLSGQDSLTSYSELLKKLFPESKTDIDLIISEIAKVMGYMDVLYGIDNPIFVEDRSVPYLKKTMLPWLIRYIKNIGKIGRLSRPIKEYLAEFTQNRSLIDMITQHFFDGTPAFFALSYFSLYLDYIYPKGGTGTLPRKLEQYLVEQGGSIATGAHVISVNVKDRMVRCSDGACYRYQTLIWAADASSLYTAIDANGVKGKTLKNLTRMKQLTGASRGSNSVLSVFAAVDLDPYYFKNRSGPHAFYTPRTEGLTSCQSEECGFLPSETLSRDEIKGKVKRYLELTTYEISCPVLRDPALAPEGKTGVIISTLMDYRLIKEVHEAGWYPEFKEFCLVMILEILSKSIYPGLNEKVLWTQCSTPLTIERLTGNKNGAITGWSFLQHPIPSESNFRSVTKSIYTPIPHVLQAGQWAFSPSGVPISVLTGKLAADEALKSR